MLRSAASMACDCQDPSLRRVRCVNPTGIRSSAPSPIHARIEPAVRRLRLGDANDEITRGMLQTRQPGRHPRRHGRCARLSRGDPRLEGPVVGRGPDDQRGRGRWSDAVRARRGATPLFAGRRRRRSGDRSDPAATLVRERRRRASVDSSRSPLGRTNGAAPDDDGRAPAKRRDHEGRRRCLDRRSRRSADRQARGALRCQPDTRSRPAPR